MAQGCINLGHIVWLLFRYIIYTHANYKAISHTYIYSVLPAISGFDGARCGVLRAVLSSSTWPQPRAPRRPRLIFSFHGKDSVHARPWCNYNALEAAGRRRSSSSSSGGSSGGDGGGSGSSRETPPLLADVGLILSHSSSSSAVCEQLNELTPEGGKASGPPMVCDLGCTGQQIVASPAHHTELMFPGISTALPATHRPRWHLDCSIICRAEIFCTLTAT